MFWAKHRARSWIGWKEPALDTQTYCLNFLRMVLQDFSEKWLLRAQETLASWFL